MVMQAEGEQASRNPIGSTGPRTPEGKERRREGRRGFAGEDQFVVMDERRTLRPAEGYTGVLEQGLARYAEKFGEQPCVIGGGPRGAQIEKNATNEPKGIRWLEIHKLRPELRLRQKTETNWHLTTWLEFANEPKGGRADIEAEHEGRDQGGGRE
jgi:hypothetical protein